MEMQAEAERRKRAEILESEGRREAAINNAEGLRRSAILAAQGDAEAVVNRALAAARAIEAVGAAVRKPGGREAVTVRLAEQYVAAFARIAKTGNTLLLPAATGDPSAMVAQAMAVWGSLSNRASAHIGSESPGNTEESGGADASLDSISSSVSDSASDVMAEVNASAHAMRATLAHAFPGAKPVGSSTGSAGTSTFVPKSIDEHEHDGGSTVTPPPGFAPKPY